MMVIFEIDADGLIHLRPLLASIRRDIFTLIHFDVTSDGVFQRTCIDHEWWNRPMASPPDVSTTFLVIDDAHAPSVADFAPTARLADVGRLNTLLRDAGVTEEMRQRQPATHMQPKMAKSITSRIGKQMAKVCSSALIRATLDRDLWSIDTPECVDGLDCILMELSDVNAVDYVRLNRRKGEVVRQAPSGKAWRGSIGTVCLITRDQDARPRFIARAKGRDGDVLVL